MRLNFPIKNLTINYLHDFLEEGKIKDFMLLKENEYPFEDNYLDASVQYFMDFLPNFENEILQVINTTTQETINFYFDELLENISILREEISLAYIKKNIEDYNSKELASFELKAEENTHDYFNKAERKLKHLEMYEANNYVMISGLGYPNKYMKTNYNFYCIEEVPELVDMSFAISYFNLVSGLANEFMEIARRYGEPFKKGKIISKHAQAVFNKPVLFVEGEHDISYIRRASELLNEIEILSQFEIRQRNGFRNLDKLVEIFKNSSWETIPQIKVVLYDCDTNKINENFGYVHKRVIPTVNVNRKKKGIENLLPNSLIDRAISHKPRYIDTKFTKGTSRGVPFEEEVFEVNPNEKTNLCNWVCENATSKEMESFKCVFDILKSVI